MATGKEMIPKDLSRLREARSHYGKRVRSGKATPEEVNLLTRVQTAIEYVWSREERGKPKPEINGWWSLPIAERFWRSDAQHAERD